MKVRSLDTKRFIVVKEIAETFTNQVVQLMEKCRWADPTDAATQMGPLWLVWFER